MKAAAFVLLSLLLLLPPLLISSTFLKSFVSSLVLIILVLGFGGFYIFSILWLKSAQRLRWKLQKQGINGPKPSFLYGNVPEMQMIQAASVKAPTNYGEFVAHDYTSSLFPYFEQWRKLYGPIYTYSTGNKQHLYVNQPELVKEMNQSISLDLGKPSYVTKRLAPMLGNGILRSNGHIWAMQRKIVAPEFFMDKVKHMVSLMLQSAELLTRKWDENIEAEGSKMAEISVGEDLRSFSADVISRACFGSSYFKGKKIFSKLRTLQKIISNQSVLFGSPALGFLPSRQQKEIENLEKEIESLIWEAVKERERECIETSSNEKDLLHSILEGAINDDSVGENSSRKFIVDNCKNIYFAGHESTAVAASWCLMLLALHPEWQSRIRDEMAQICPDGVLDAESVSKMKEKAFLEMGKIWIEVCLISARGLRKTSSLWKLQWYAVGWIDPNNKYCSKIDSSGNANPVWKTKFSMLVDTSELDALHVEVYGREPIFLREKLVGTATVILKEFLDKYNNNSEVSKPIEEVGSFQLRRKNSNKPQGFVDVSIRISEEREEPSSLPGDNEGFKLADNCSGFNLANGYKPAPAYQPQSLTPSKLQGNQPQPNHQYARPVTYPTNYSHPSVGGTSYAPAAGPSYQPHRAPPPPPPPPANVGYIPTFLPRTDNTPPSYFNMPQTGAAAARNARPGFGMGVGAGALAAGAVIFGEDFMSGFDIPRGLQDPSLTISLDPPF